MRYSRKAATEVVAPFANAPEGICRWCGKPVEGRRKTWCSKACVDEYMTLKIPAKFRSAVFERAEGRCEICRLDVAELEARLQLARGRGWEDWLREWAMFFAARFGPKVIGLWEVDHVVPLVEGGAHHPTNAMLVCVPCHKTKTRLEATKRAESRQSLDTRRRRSAPSDVPR